MQGPLPFLLIIPTYPSWAWGPRKREGEGCDCNEIRLQCNATQCDCNALRMQSNAIVMHCYPIAMLCDCNTMGRMQ